LEVNTGGVEQKASSGPVNWKVTVPVGAVPPFRVAVPWILVGADEAAAIDSWVMDFSTITAAEGSEQVVGPAAAYVASPL